MHTQKNSEWENGRHDWDVSDTGVASDGLIVAFRLDGTQVGRSRVDEV